MNFTKKLKSYKLQANSGQALLEAIVAINIIMAAMLGIFVLLSNSIGYSRVSANQSIAVNLAAEGIEVVKSILDKNAIKCEEIAPAPCVWNIGLINCTSGCDVQFDSQILIQAWQNEPLKFDPVAGTYNHNIIGDDTIFTRRITVDTLPSGNEIRVTSEVSWTDRGGDPFSVMLEDRFFNWR